MEVVWLDALHRPAEFGRAFLRSRGNSEVREFLAQMEPGLTHEKVLARLRVAQRIHRVLARLTLPLLIGDTDANELRKFDVGRLLALDALDVEDRQPIARWPYPERTRRGEPIHPVQAILGPLGDAPILAMEALLLIAVLDAIQRNVHPAFDKLLYVYLGLMAQFGRLVVQGRHQIGFDQFQKITLNEMREDLEGRRYKERIQQLQSTPRGDMDALEFRIAPKDTPGKNLAQLRKIGAATISYLNGADCMAQPAAGTRRLPGAEAPSLRRPLEVTLVAHFIKKRDDRKVLACRHYLLRRRIAEQCRALMMAIRSSLGQDLNVPVVGFDAASNELHAPPEAFAPLFRSLRNAGHVNFTFHVGEDFVHLVSGIRAMVEAAEFLDMTPGNRIGHGTAIGVPPSLWRERMGTVTTIHQGEWLDNLIFARTVLVRAGRLDICPRIDEQIASLVSRVYGKWYPSDHLYRAWEMRHLDPLTALGLNGCLEDTLDEGTRREFMHTEKAIQEREAFHLFEAYHDTDIVKRGNEWIRVTHEERRVRSVSGWNDRHDPFTPEVLSVLQGYATELLERRRLVIETLPTSNVRIHVYQDYHEHHLFRWLGFGNPPINMPVVVGTDDPGIFATSIRNEYTHILRELDSLCTNTAPRPEDILEKLIHNGKTWRFRSG